MTWNWRIAVPYLIGFAIALVEAALNWTNTLHVSGTTAVLLVAAGKVIGDAIRAQLLIAQAKHPQ